jgi:hypothetical protein
MDPMVRVMIQTIRHLLYSCTGRGVRSTLTSLRLGMGIPFFSHRLLPTLRLNRVLSLLPVEGRHLFQDDGNGHFFDGAGGQFATGTIVYATGVCAITYVAAPANLAVLTINYTAWLNITQAYNPLPPVTNELIGTGNTVLLAFSHTVAQPPIVPGTLVVDAGASGDYQDNGAGGFNEAVYGEAYSAGSASLLTFAHTLATTPVIPKSVFLYKTGV